MTRVWPGRGRPAQSGFSSRTALGQYRGNCVLASGILSRLRRPGALLECHWALFLTLLITQAGGGVAPLTIVAVVVAYLATLALSSRRKPAPIQLLGAAGFRSVLGGTDVSLLSLAP